MTTKTTIAGKFYPLQHEEWRRACKELTPAARDVLYFVRTLDPYSDGVEVSAAEIAKQLSTDTRTVHRSTISRAFKELDTKGFIDLELIRAYVTVKPKGVHCCEEATGCDDTLPVASPQQCCDDATTEAVTQHEHNIDRAHVLNTLNTNSDLITQEGVSKNLDSGEPGGSTDILVAPSSIEEAKSEESQIARVDQSSAAPLMPTQIYIPTVEEQSYSMNRLFVQSKATYTSRSADPWMDGINPNRQFVQWILNTRQNEQKNGDERYNTYTPTPRNIRKELRNDAVAAQGLWEDFQEEMTHRVQVHNTRVEAGIPISPGETEEVKAIAPYSTTQMKSPLLIIAPGSGEAAQRFERNLPLESLLVNLSASSASVPEGAEAVEAYKEYKAEIPLTDEQIAENKRRFSEMVRGVTKSIPKATVEISYSSNFDKYKAWIVSDEPALISAAKEWVQARADIFEVEYDGYGNILDFSEVSF